MKVNQLNRIAAIRAAGLFLALFAGAALMIACNQGYANADRPLSGTLNALVEETFSGKIISIGNKQFVMKDDKDAEHTFTVNDETKYTLGGNEAIFSELKVDHAVTVKGKKDGKHFVAKVVDAISA
ncbi:MAG TPA: DUF5666 domain-containing protein [Planctomycetaceae bacterium]|nr:DUF5666 domain-containing protein [Planctomycetaceae bacterium]